MSRLWLCPTRDTSQKDTFQFKEFKTCSDVFCDASQLHHHWLLPTIHLTRSYQEVAQCSKCCRNARLKRSLQTASNQRISSVSLSQVSHKNVNCKPSHYPQLISPLWLRKPRTARAQSRSTITPQPLKTGVKSGGTTNTWSPRLKNTDLTSGRSKQY